MTTTEWHVTDDLWNSYLGGSLDPLLEASLERHVNGCARCRAAARDLAAPRPGTWQGIHIGIARPRLPRSLAWAVRRGLREDVATLVASTRELTLATAVAVGAAVACAITVGVLGDRPPLSPDLLFLITAPLIPLLAVVASYDATDDLRELTTTLPFSSLRLNLLRAAAGLAIAIPATFVVGLVVPGIGPATAGWLLPGLALAAAGITALTWTSARVAGPALAAAWMLGASLAARSDHLAGLARPAGQLLSVAVLLFLLAVLVRRTHSQIPFPGAQR